MNKNFSPICDNDCINSTKQIHHDLVYRKQAKGPFVFKLASTVGASRSDHAQSQNQIFSPRGPDPWCGTENSSWSLQGHFSYKYHWLWLAEHPAECRIHDTVQLEIECQTRPRTHTQPWMNAVNGQATKPIRLKGDMWFFSGLWPTPVYCNDHFRINSEHIRGKPLRISHDHPLMKTSTDTIAL